MVFAQRSTIGIMSATIGVLFKNADAKQTEQTKRSCALALFLGTPSSFPTYQSIAPVMVRPWATTNRTYNIEAKEEYFGEERDTGVSNIVFLVCIAFSHSP